MRVSRERCAQARSLKAAKFRWLRSKGHTSGPSIQNGVRKGDSEDAGGILTRKFSDGPVKIKVPGVLLITTSADAPNAGSQRVAAFSVVSNSTQCPASSRPSLNRCQASAKSFPFMYFRPVSLATVTTVLPGPNSLAIRMAAVTLRPVDVPTNSPSSRASWWHIARASSSGMLRTSSYRSRLRSR